MARPKSNLTPEQKAERSRLNAKAWRARQKAKAIKESKSAPAAPVIKTGTLENEIERVRTMIAARGQALLAQAISGMTEGKSVAQVIASFGDSAGKDAQTEALVTLLATLQRAQTVSAAVAAGKYDDVVAKVSNDAAPAVEVKRRVKAAKSRKRA